MKYWDSSGLLPLLVNESTSTARREVLRSDRGVVTWWGSLVECASALNRLQREQLIDVATLTQLLSNLDHFATHWIQIPPVDQARRIAMRLLRIHSVRAADALQLAAALIAADNTPETLDFVTNDDRLAIAAQLEGFRVL